MTLVPPALSAFSLFWLFAKIDQAAFSPQGLTDKGAGFDDSALIQNRIGTQKLRAPKAAPEISGMYVDAIDRVAIYEANGSLLPGVDAAGCTHRYSFLKNSTVFSTVNYDVALQRGQAKSIVFGHEVTLHPAGVEGQYMFLSSGVPDYLKTLFIKRVILIVDVHDGQTTGSSVAVMLPAPWTVKNKDRSCVLSSGSSQRSASLPAQLMQAH